MAVSQAIMGVLIGGGRQPGFPCSGGNSMSLEAKKGEEATTMGCPQNLRCVDERESLFP